MFWKDFFYFTRSQQNALVILLAMILLLFAIQLFFDIKQTDVKRNLEDSLSLRELQDFRTSLVACKKKPYRKNYSSFYKKNVPIKPTLFVFNPNTLDSVGFVKLGIKPYIAKNILRYRAKGGVFKTAEAFSKVYGLSSEQFAQLEAYIQIPKTEKTIDSKKEVPIELVELNRADTTQLKSLSGIGSSLARRIIAYRNKLGGFNSPNQIKEVWGISPELAEKLIPYMKVDASQIKKISVNRSGIDRLKNHPYFNFYRAKAIYEYRKEHGKIKSLEACKDIEDPSLNEEFWQKVEPYLEFN